MLRVTVEMVPGGREDEKRVLSTLLIANNGEGYPPDRVGDYLITHTPGDAGAISRRSLRDFARSAGHLALVEEALRCLRCIPRAWRRPQSRHRWEV